MLYCHNILSKYQCGFKGQNQQHCLITMTKNFVKRKRVNKGDVFRVLLTDLSNALSHEHLIGELYLQGFDMKLLNLIHDYLSKKKQRVKVMVNGGNYCMVFNWDQFWSHCYLLFFFGIYSVFSHAPLQQVTRTISHYTVPR